MNNTRFFKIYLIYLFISFLLSCSPKALLDLGLPPAEKEKPVSQATFDVQQQFNQVTTHPEIDIMPALSPDGRWIAFASKRSGNMDIWVKPIKGGRAIQVTTHQADDLYPCWAPDGESMVFVSQREDAEGDLWQLKIDTRQGIFSIIGNPKKLTDYLGLDESPEFSPDGKTIAFTSNRDGQRDIWLYDLKKKRFRQLTFQGGMNPTWSPDGSKIAFISFRNGAASRGDIFIVDVSLKTKSAKFIPANDGAIPMTHSSDLDALPSWSPRKDEIVFTRYARDTNGDGKINPEDQSSLWKFIFEDSTEIQLTPLDYYDYFPFWGRDDRIYFISDRSGNRDIWSIDSEGSIPAQENAFMQYQFADLYFPLPEEASIFESSQEDLLDDSAFRNAESSNIDIPPNPPSKGRNLQSGLKGSSETVDRDFLSLRILAFKRVGDFFPYDSTWIGLAEYDVARTYDELNDHQSANQIYHKLLQQYQRHDVIIGQVSWELLKHDILNHQADFNYLKEKIQYAVQLKNQFSNHKRFAAKLDLTIGEIYFHINEKISALKVYEDLIEKYPDEREYGAIAQLRIAEIYSDFGQGEDVIKSYLKVIDAYSEQEQWVNVALSKILTIVIEKDAFLTIANYRSIIGKYADYPRLAARAQLKIGQLLYRQQEYQPAIHELLMVEQNYPQQRDEIAQAELLISQIYFETSEDLRAINNYKKIIQNFEAVKSGLYVVAAKQQLLELYLNTGKRLRNHGDFELAFSRYQGAIEIQSRNLEAQRGLIFCLYQLGRINEAINRYQRMVIQHPDDEVSLYVLGLCWSYQATEASERAGKIELLNYALMKKSIETIETALTRNYQLIPAYLTVSYNYEVMEQYESFQRNKPQGFFTSLTKTIAAPVVSVFRFMTFQKRKPPEIWYEKAIDALTTALALNDEHQDPSLESELALNIAHNYYRLEEFGYAKAYQYYRLKMDYDTTFINLQNKAIVFERMGHCALVTEDFKDGPAYLKKAIALYQELGKEGQVLINTKRLALLYQLAGENDESIVYFRQAADMEAKFEEWNGLQQSYRSIAYNYQLLNDEEEAIRYAQSAVDLIKKRKVQEIKSKPNWIKIGILGVEIPVWNLGPIGAGESTAIEGFTTAEEKALVYSIMADAYLQQKNYPKAIEYYEKKLEIYRQRKDKTAEAIFLNNIGFLYYSIENYSAAWSYFQSSLKICEAQELPAGILSNIINLGGLGVLFRKLNDDQIDYFKLCLKYLKDGLKLYSTELLGFEEERVQIYILLGNLHYLQNIAVVDSDANHLQFHVTNLTHRFEAFSEAERYYYQAIEFARAQNYLLGQVIIYQNLGHLYFSVAEDERAFFYFNEARTIAFKHNYTDMIWRSDFAIANFLSFFNDEKLTESGANRDAGFYFKEAIQFLEDYSILKESFNPTQFYTREVRNLYENAVQYFIHKAPGDALMLSERMRAKNYLDLVSSHKIELKKERHKNYIGLSRDDNRRITELDKKIRNAKLDPATTRKVMNELLAERKELLAQNKKLFDEMNEEDPELESMVHVNPIPLPGFQSILTPNTIVFNYFMTDDTTYVWLIDQNRTDFVAIPVKRDSIENKLNTFLFMTQNNFSEQSFHLLAHQLYEILLSPFSNKFEQYQKIIIIPDGRLNFVPFNALIKLFSESPQVVVIAPSLSNYYYSFQKRKLRGDNVLLVGGEALLDTLEQMGFSRRLIEMDDESDKNKMKQKIQNSEIVHLSPTIKWNVADPLVTQLTITSNTTLREKEIYSYDMMSNLIILSGNIFQSYPDEQNFTSLNRALFYAGTPTILYSLWPVDRSDEEKFFRYFYHYLLDYPPGQALTFAQQSMMKDSTSMSSWAGYQLVGFEGMTDAEEKQFALDQLEKRVRSAYISAEEKDYAEAIREYEIALSMARKLANDKYIRVLRQQIINTATLSSNYEKAIEQQTEILTEAEYSQNLQTVVQSYAYLAIFFTESENYEQAVFYQNKYIEAVETYGLKKNLADSYQKLGLIYERGSNFQKAIEFYGKAITAYQTADDFIGMAKSFNDRGRVYLTNLDNYTSAIEDQIQALRLFQQEGDDENAIEALQNIGLGYERLADYRTALEYQNKALQLAQDSGAEDKVAIAYQYLANVKWKLGDYQEALKYQKQALQKFQDLGNERFQLIGLSTQGLILLGIGQHQAGLEAESAALRLAEKLADKKDQATIHKNIGLIYIALQKYESALAAFQRALAIDSGINYKRGLAYDYRNLGSLYITMGQPDSALSYLRKALTLSQAIEDRRNETQCFYEIGRAQFALNRTDAALDSLKLAADQAKFLLIPDIEWRALRAAGQVHEQRGQADKAVENFQNAISVIEQMRAMIKVEEFQSGFIDDKLDVYSDLIMLWLRMQKPNQAFEIVERAKSRSFLDMLANRDISYGSQASDQLLAQGLAIQNQIVKVQAELATLRSRQDQLTVMQRQTFADLENNLIKLKQQYSDYLISLKEQNAELAEIISAAPSSLPEIQSILPDSTALLEYYYTRANVAIWAITNNGVNFAIVDQPDSILSRSVIDFRAAIQNKLSITAIATHLYKLLIDPISSKLTGIKHLTIIPQNILHYLPFAALMDEQGRYLIEKYSISLAPSATVLGFCFEKGQKYKNSDRRRQKILAFGNPDLGNPELTLPFAEKEIESIKLLYPDVTAYLERQATETRLKAKEGDADIFLLSCHGEFDEMNPLFSALLLAPDNQNDGRLEAHEIFGLDFNAYLIAMSACETGLGSIKGGDEVIGLTRSFIYAGSASLLSSLWKVDDLATAVMIKRFFRYLKDPAQSRASALRKAQLLVKAEINSHPAFWAAFNISGDFR